MGSATIQGAAAHRRVDSRWFKDVLALRQMSGRGLAKRLGMEPSAWSRVLSGERRLAVDEVQAVARELHVSPDDVVERLGVSIARDTVKNVPLRHRIGADGSLAPVRGIERLPVPPGAIGGTEAARIEGEGVDSSVDGWTVYYTPAIDVGVEAMGRLCVVRCAGKKSSQLAVLRQGYKPGRFNLAPPCFLPTGSREQDVTVLTASPVTWIGC